MMLEKRTRAQKLFPRRNALCRMIIFGQFLFLSVVIMRPLIDDFYYTKTIDFLRRSAAQALIGTNIDSLA